MSTQSPLNQPPAQCSTNWLTRLACKAQKLIEPLCEKSSNFKLNAYEQNVVALDLRQTNSLTGWQSSTHHTAQQWTDIIESNGLAMSEGTARLLAPRLTLTNKLGLGLWKVFSVGTECSCCWGLRLIVVAAFWFSIGYIARGFK